jgi:hypothetical protein
MRTRKKTAIANQMATGRFKPSKWIERDILIAA